MYTKLLSLHDSRPTNLQEKLATPRTIINNKDLDQYAQMGALFPTVRSGTGIFYAAPGKEIGSQIQFRGIVLEVPKEYQGLKDAALLLEHPDFWLRSTSDILMTEGKLITEGKIIGVTYDFPRKDGWYLTDEFGIPQGKEVSPNYQISQNPNARYLYRVNGEYGGVVARLSIILFGKHFWRAIYVTTLPEVKLRAVTISNSTSPSEAMAIVSSLLRDNPPAQ
jgi:hypothetical protein